MTLKLLTTCLLCCLSLTGFSQIEEGATEAVRERFRAERVAISTDVLKLTSTEAQGFWPIFNQFLNDKEQINKQYKPVKTGNLSDAEAEENVRKHFEKQQKELDMERELVQKLRKVITVQQIARMPEAEKLFRKRVLEQAKERAKERRENNAPRRKAGGRK